MQALKGLMMEKQLCWAGMGVAGVLFIVFLLDFITKMPFGLREVSGAVEIIILLCCALLGYLSWDAFREQI